MMEGPWEREPGTGRRGGLEMDRCGMCKSKIDQKVPSNMGIKKKKDLFFFACM